MANGASSEAERQKARAVSPIVGKSTRQADHDARAWLMDAEWRADGRQ